MISTPLAFDRFSLLRRKIWVPVLFTVLFLIVLPLRVGIRLEYWLNEENQLVYEHVRLNIASFFAGYDSWITALLLSGAVLAGIAFFDYLHQRQQSDFFHCLPVGRPSLFMAHLGAAFCSVVIPYLLALVLAVFVALVFGLGPYLDFAVIIKAFCLHVLYFTAVLTTVALAMVLTGQNLIAILCSATILLLFPCVDLIYFGMRSMVHPAWYQEIANVTQLMYYGSPLVRWFYYAGIDLRNSWQAVPYIPLGEYVLTLFHSVLMVVLGLYAYKRRPSERAGRSLAFPVLRPVVKYPFAVLVSAGGGLILYGLGGNDGWIWFLIGAGISSILFCQMWEIICANDFKMIGKRLRGCVIYTALFLGGSLFLLADVPGYNSFVPAPKDVAGVHIQLSGVDFAWNDYPVSRQNTAFFSDQEETEYARQRLDRVYSTDADVIAAVCSIAEKVGGSEYRNADGHSGLHLIVRWHMENGREKIRAYPMAVDICQIQQELDTLYANDQFRTERLALFAHDPACVRMFAVVSYGDPYSEEYQSDYRVDSPWINLDISELLAVYEQELSALTSEQMRQTLPVGEIRFRVYEEDPGDTVDTTGLENYTAYTYPLYEEFEKTIAVLEEMNACPDRWDIDISQITSAHVYYYMDETDDSDMPQAIYSSEPYFTEDPEELQQLAAHTESSAAYWLTGFREYSREAEVEFHSEENGWYHVRLYPKGMEPDIFQ